MKKLWMIMGLAVGLACQGEGAAPQLPADAANWSVVNLVKGRRDALAAGNGPGVVNVARALRCAARGSQR